MMTKHFYSSSTKGLNCTHLVRNVMSKAVTVTSRRTSRTPVTAPSDAMTMVDPGVLLVDPAVRVV